MCKVPIDESIQTPISSIQPTLIPKLQYQSVISIVVGDYHYGALTSTGRLFTWGSFSKGALGLGDPVTLPVGSPGGFNNEGDIEVTRNARGWMPIEPNDVEIPTEVRFDHMFEGERKTYCFAVAAAGWHMGALVFDFEVSSTPTFLV